ncbi:MAG: choice-of-anchor Q domain-containing protein [Verrucomicrobiota bacterium]
MRLGNHKNTPSSPLTTARINRDRAPQARGPWLIKHAEARFHRAILATMLALLFLGSLSRWAKLASHADRPVPPGRGTLLVEERRAPSTPPGALGALRSAVGSSPRPTALAEIQRPQETNDSVVEPLAAFNDWVAGYLTAGSAAERSALESKGLALARQRRPILKSLIETDPERSLQAAVPRTVRQALPASIVSELEEAVEGDGRLDVIARLPATADEAAPPAIKRFVTIQGQTYRAFAYGRRLTQVSAASLPLHGIAVEDALAVHEDAARLLEPGEVPKADLPVANVDGRCPVSGEAANPIVAAQAGDRVYHLCHGQHVAGLNQSLAAKEAQPLAVSSAAPSLLASSGWSTGPKRVLLMRVSYADFPSASCSEEDAAKLITSVNAFFEQTSFGLLSVQATITSVLALPGTVASYLANDQRLLSDARQVAGAAGYNLQQFDLDAILCGSLFRLNQAFIGTRGAWLSGVDPGTACHEFGHNLGLYHANAWVTSDGTVIGAGRNQEYGNRFDTMGSGSGLAYSFNAFEKHLLGWMPESAVTTVVSNGTYRLFAIDAPALDDGQTYGLKVAKDSQRDYWIELRQAAGDSQLKEGILLTWSPWAESNGGTHLLNCNPGRYAEPALQVGHASYDFESGLKIMPLQVNSAEPKWADVQVERIFFLGFDLPWPPANGGSEITAVDSDHQPSVEGPAERVRVQIPADGFYAIWIQAVDDSSTAEPIAVALDDEAGDIGPASSLAPAGVWAWADFGSSVNEASASSSPRTFFLAAGEHTLRVRVLSGQPRALHLLITSDSATDLPPVLSEIDDQSVIAGESLQVPFSVTAIGRSVPQPTVRITSENPNVIGSEDLVLQTRGSEWTLTINSSEKRSGTTRIYLTLIDSSGRTMSQSFALSVLGRAQALVRQAAPGERVVLPAGLSYENLVIDKNLTLEGAGINQTIIDGWGNGPVITISLNCSVRLFGLTLRNGLGAGVRNFGTLQLIASSVEKNQGSGVQNRGTLVLEKVLLQDNQAAQGGGLDNSAKATLRDCAVIENSATGGGGGVINRKGGTLVFETGCIAANRAAPANGGGVWNLGELTLRTSTVSDNVASDLGKVDSRKAGWIGGGIANSGQLKLESSTICRNQAKAEGGGLNNSGQAELVNTIVAANSSLLTSAADVSGTLTSAGHNLIQVTAGASLSASASDILGQDPLLGQLSDNGGPTKSVALLPGSPAIDAGDYARGAPMDQRGLPRPLGGGCDIGAFEYEPAAVCHLQHGVVEGHFDLSPGQQYVLEASCDLAVWTALGPYQADAKGGLSFTDSASDCPNKFYRVRPAAAGSGLSASNQ